MNLADVHKLLVAADQQPHGFLKVRGRHADRELRSMVEADLIEATFSDGKDQSFTTINRITAFGHAFLRTFKNHPIPTRVKGMAGEWNLNP
jgi:hypothetical protein